jgi:hypothetical protein
VYVSKNGRFCPAHCQRVLMGILNMDLRVSWIFVSRELIHQSINLLDYRGIAFLQLLRYVTISGAFDQGLNRTGMGATQLSARAGQRGRELCLQLSHPQKGASQHARILCKRWWVLSRLLVLDPQHWNGFQWISRSLASATVPMLSFSRCEWEVTFLTLTCT